VRAAARSSLSGGRSIGYSRQYTLGLTAKRNCTGNSFRVPNPDASCSPFDRAIQWDQLSSYASECLLTTSAQHGHSIRYGVQVLKESFVGNSRTVMIANISPNSSACECVHAVA
jgi:hypothetical protein